jgi:hypothetical protein
MCGFMGANVSDLTQPNVDLISGRPVGLTSASDVYLLESDRSRSILDWYRQNRSKWSGNVMVSDIESIVDASRKNPPNLKSLVINSSPGRHQRRLRLAKIEAHQFGGLHAAPSSTGTSPNFIFEPRELVTLFEGWNGSGKTSLLNAVVWCLTGQILRPQRKPDAGNIEFECRVDRSQGASEEGQRYPIPN